MTYRFDIPRQRADKALTELARQADTQILFQFDVVKRFVTNAVEGEYTLEEAVTLLLEDTGLKAVVSEPFRLAIMIDEKVKEESEVMNKKLTVGGAIAAFFAGMFAAQGVDAQQAGARSGSPLEEIVVTATKREQSLQDVAAAVSVYGRDRLIDSRINTLEDLQVLAPGITITNDFNIAKFFIRGVGIEVSNSGVDPAVALHVDGVVVSRPEAQLDSFFDLERVEMLRGPQGTLYGRNAVGGSVNLVTAKPTEEMEGYGRVTVGNFSTLDFEGAISGPVIGDTVLGRVAFKSQNRNGFGTNPVTGSDIDDLSRQMARIHLQFQPTDRFSALLTGEWYNQNDNSAALKVRRASFPDTPGFEPLGEGGFASGTRDLASNVDPGTNTDSWYVAGTFDWQITDTFKITNITSYRDFQTILIQDLDGSAIDNSLATTGEGTLIQFRNVFSEQFSTELRMHYDDEWVSAVLGLFYFDEEFGTKRNSLGAAPGHGQPINLVTLANFGVDPQVVLDRCNLRNRLADAPLSPPRLCGRSDLKTEAFAVFGQAVINLGRFFPGLDNVSLKLGGRYSDEDRSIANPTTIIARAGLGPVIQRTEETASNAKSFDSFDPEVGVEWQASDDMLFYFTYSEGFKSGTGQASLSGNTTIVDPQTIDNYEFGLKSSWYGGRLTTNVAGFFYDMAGLQVSKTFFDFDNNVFITSFENAAQASAKGIEVEILAVPFDGLRFSGSVAWLDAQFDDFETADNLDIRNIAGPRPDPSVPPFDPENIQLAGNKLRNSPEWSSNVNIAYDIPGVQLPANGLLTLSTDIAFKSEHFFSEFNRPIEGASSYTIVDTALRYRSGDGRITAAFWAKNLTDKLVASGTFPQASGRIIGVNYLPPRTYGFTLGYNF